MSKPQYHFSAAEICFRAAGPHLFDLSIPTGGIQTMGSSTSKSSAPSSQHVFARLVVLLFASGLPGAMTVVPHPFGNRCANVLILSSDAPVRFSQELIDSLQTSSEVCVWTSAGKDRGSTII